MERKIGAGCAYNINYHFVWCPKRRAAVLTGEIALACEKLIREIAEKNDLTIEALQIMPEHVHIFVSAPPKLSPALIVKRLKGATAHQLRDKFPSLSRLPSLWSSSYYVGTVGQVSESIVKLYIENQKGR